MKELFTNKYFILLLAVTVILLVLIGFYTVDRQSVTFGEDIIGAIVTPIQSVFTSVSSGIAGFFGYFGDVDAVKRENEEMKDEINRLNGIIRRQEGYASENAEMRKMLEFKKNKEEYTLVAAEVIAKDPGSWYNSFTINKGTKSGLAARQTVVTSDGLVGYIYEIGTNWAKVISILDVNGVGAQVVRTRDIALVESDAELQRQGLCRMTYINKSASVIPNDIIETSGKGGIYPGGILIGHVLEVRPDTAGISQYAIVKPAANFERISHVFVITDYPEPEEEL